MRYAIRESKRLDRITSDIICVFHWNGLKKCEQQWSQISMRSKIVLLEHWQLTPYVVYYYLAFS